MANKLNKSFIDQLLGKPQARNLEIADGNNLYLIVTKIGSCKFKYRIRRQNKASWVAIGDYPDISLNDARKAALETRAMLSKGIDPNQHKRDQQSKQTTLNALFEQYVKERLKLVRKNERSQRNYLNSVKNSILNVIGNMPIPNISYEVIREKLIAPKVENDCASSARLILINIKILLDFAIEKGIIEYNPATKIKTSSIYRDKPRSRFLTKTEIKTFLNLVYNAPIKTQNKFAFHLSLLMLTRKTELIHATWDSIDFESKTFTIKQSKMGTQLVTILPWQAIKMFETLKVLSQDSKYIFTGRYPNTPLSSEALNYVLKPFNYEMFGNDKENYFTIHDLRRTGATLLGEMGYPSDYIEVALNHSKGGIKQVYQRSRFIEQRKDMLQNWANTLDKLINPDLLPYDKYFPI